MKTNTRDRTAVLMGACHNIGAGGVVKGGEVYIPLMSDKRFDQYVHRTDRAGGVHQSDTRKNPLKGSSVYKYLGSRYTVADLRKSTWTDEQIRKHCVRVR